MSNQFTLSSYGSPILLIMESCFLNIGEKGRQNYIIAIYISTGENIACIIGIYRGFHFMGEIETFWIIF